MARIPRTRTLVATLVAASLLAACGGGSTGSPLPTSNTGGNIPPIGSTGPASFRWGQRMLQQASYIGPLTKPVAMSMLAQPQLQNEAGLISYAQQASTPGNPNYRHFLTPQQIGQLYGAAPVNQAKVAAYFQQYGIGVGSWPQNLVLSLVGSSTQFTAALGVKFGYYQYGKERFIAPIGTPHVNGSIPLAALNALVPIASQVHDYIIRPSSGSFGPGLSPQQVARAFDYSGAYNAGLTGSGIGLGIIGTGPIDPNDVPYYGAAFHTRVATVSLIPTSPLFINPATIPALLGPGFPATGFAMPPPVTTPLDGNFSTCQATGTGVPNFQTCNLEDGEAQLDTETTASLAPGVNENFYLAYYSFCYNSATGAIDPANVGVTTCPAGETLGDTEGISIADFEIQQAIADNRSDVLSLSYGGGEMNFGAAYVGPGGTGLGPAEFAALAAEGIAVFVSSGDTGNAACAVPYAGLYPTTPCVSYPATDTNVVAVGGVNLPVDGAGNIIGQVTAWADQTTLGGDGSFGNNIGSGGGVSVLIPAPAWQAGLTLTGGNPQLGGFRGIPDIAMDADPLTGQAFGMYIAEGGTISAVGGTSLAAPQAAAQWALVLQACKQSATCGNGSTGPYSYRLGNPAPLFYQLASTPASYASVFKDITYGENEANQNGGGGPPGPPITGCCFSTPGYDLVTGLGVPMTGHLITAITKTPVN